jgi:hypothetical protein
VRKKTALLLLAVVLTAYGEIAEYERDQLRGLKAVKVIVDLTETGKKSGLSEYLLKTQVTKSLTNAGISVPDSTCSEFVSVVVHTMELEHNNGFIYRLDASLQQPAFLRRNLEVCYSVVCLGSSLGKCPSSEGLVDAVQQYLGQYTNEFVIAYLLANKEE